MNNYNTLQTFTKALNFAAYKHRDQRRKNGDIPYINHPIQVANILSKANVTNFQILSAAILHDTIQDTETTKQQLQKQFGHNITKWVLQCSDDKSLGKVERKKVQIHHAKQASKQAKLIKIGDKLSNCLDLQKKAPQSWTKQRIFGYYLWAYTVCKGLNGVNQILDKQLDQLWTSVGVLKLDQNNANKTLEEYYVILGNSKGEK